jgi:ethanolamine permease
MYVLSMTSLLVLRRREPDLPRPFRAPLYPASPAVALALSAASLAALAVSEARIAAVFGAIMVTGAVYFRALPRDRLDPRWVAGD